MKNTRPFWKSRTAFLLAAIGSAVGLGNLWRFPYVAYQNGGGAFLVPYFVALLTTGIPLLIGEYIIGKRSQAGAPKAIQKISPKFEWVGWWAAFTAFGIVVYYMAVMAWSWFYLAKSPWTPWSGDAKGFFFSDVLNLSGGPLELGGLVWPLVGGVVLSWVLCYLIVRKGTESVTKVVRWTVPIPYALLFILLIHGITQPGAMDGLAFYLTPDWSILSNASVWLAAYGQIFFSLSLGAGIMIAYASYLKKEEDVSWQATVAGLANSATEFFAGFIVFSVIGALAAVLNAPVDEVAASGPGLAFVAFPTALSALPLPGVFSFVFFAALLTLGIDSAFSLIEAVVTAIADKFKSISRHTVLVWTCIVGGVISLLFVTEGGLYWLDIVDHWMNSYGLVGVGLAQALLITLAIGTGNLRKEINAHTIWPVGKFWEISVKVITPIALVLTFIFALRTELTTNYEGYPTLALVLGGWGFWSLILVVSVLLQKDKSKWFFLALFVLLAATLIIGLTHSPAAAMGIVGITILGGGLLKMYLLGRKHKMFN